MPLQPTSGAATNQNCCLGHLISDRAKVYHTSGLDRSRFVIHATVAGSYPASTIPDDETGYRGNSLATTPGHSCAPLPLWRVVCKPGATKGFATTEADNVGGNVKANDGLENATEAQAKTTRGYRVVYVDDLLILDQETAESTANQVQSVWCPPPSWLSAERMKFCGFVVHILVGQESCAVELECGDSRSGAQRDWAGGLLYCLDDDEGDDGGHDGSLEGLGALEEDYGANWVAL